MCWFNDFGGHYLGVSISFKSVIHSSQEAVSLSQMLLGIELLFIHTKNYEKINFIDRIKEFETIHKCYFHL